MIKKMCKEAGCTCACEGSFCDKHQRKRTLFAGTKRAGSAEYNKLYKTARWKKMRKEFLATHPICVICGNTATTADHITPHRGDEGLFYNEANLQALCASCHSRKTLEENSFFHRAGKGRAQLDR